MEGKLKTFGPQNIHMMNIECRRYLATGSRDDHSVYIWDMATAKRTQLLRLHRTLPITILSWSPNGQYVFAAMGRSSIFWLWDTTSWTAQKWNCPGNGECTVAQWSTNSEILLLGCANQQGLIPLQLASSSGQDRLLRSSPFTRSHPSMFVNTAEKFVPIDEASGETIGGVVSAFAWDPRGEKIAVCCNPSTESTGALILLYNVNWTPTLEVIPRYVCLMDILNRCDDHNPSNTMDDVVELFVDRLSKPDDRWPFPFVTILKKEHY